MEIEDIIKREFSLRVIEEGLSRIEKCMRFFSDEELWQKPSSHTNSVGNLVLHLEGNVRQYIISGVGGAQNTRKRQQEFDGGSRKERTVLFEDIERTAKQAAEIIDKLDVTALTRDVYVQGFNMTVLSCIVHVIEHFSYHVGQITFYTKQLKNIDTGYYSGRNLDQ